MQVGEKVINKISIAVTIAVWLIIFILIGSAIYDTIQYARYGLLFDFRSDATIIWLKGIIMGFGGCLWLGYKFGKHNGEKSVKIRTDTQKAS
jgi:hypothetical protein